MSKRAILPPLCRALGGSRDRQLGGTRTSPLPGGSAEAQVLGAAFLQGPTSWPLIGQTQSVQTCTQDTSDPPRFSVPRQISEDLSPEKLCMDAGQAGSGSWLKYIRVACSCDDQNLTMCQINEQVGAELASGLGAPN